jgi:hypothetical protein
MVSVSEEKLQLYFKTTTSSAHDYRHCNCSPSRVSLLPPDVHNSSLADMYRFHQWARLKIKKSGESPKEPGLGVGELGSTDSSSSVSV